MKRRKLLSLLVAAAMVLSLLPMSALAAGTEGASIDEEIQAFLDGSESSATITLSSDATFSGFDLSDGKQLIIELSGHKLSSSGGADITVLGGAGLTIQSTGETKGSLEMNGFARVNDAAIGVQTGSAVTLQNVAYTTDGTGLFPAGDAATVVVEDCTLQTKGYCLGTNAGKTDNYEVVITLTGSSFSGSNDGAGTAMYLNVPGTLDMDNCTVNGYFHGLFVRGGTAVIKNSTITNTMNDGSLSGHFDNQAWGSGNTVNLAALTLGDKSASDDSSAYRYPHQRDAGEYHGPDGRECQGQLSCDLSLSDERRSAAGNAEHHRRPGRV